MATQRTTAATGSHKCAGEKAVLLLQECLCKNNSSCALNRSDELGINCTSRLQA